MIAIIANFTFKFKNEKCNDFLTELQVKLFGEPQQCCVGTFRLQQEVFVVAAGPVRHFHHAEQNPLRFVVAGSQVLPTATHRQGKMQAQEDKKKADKSVTSYR